MTNSHFPMPYAVGVPGLVHIVPGPPQPVAVPVPVPVPFGVPIPIPEATTETTTTSTTTTCKPHDQPQEEEESDRIYVPCPPHPWPNPHLENYTLNIPPQMPYQLVAPIFPMPPPPSLVMIPIPPMIRIRSGHPRRKKPLKSDSSTSSDDCDDSESSASSSSNKRKKERKRKYGIYRSNRRLLNGGHSEEEIKPILTYHSKNGDIKFQKPLSMGEAASMMAHARKSANNVHVIDSTDLFGKPRVIIARGSKKETDFQRRQRTIEKGHKQFVFKVPNNKTVNNLTVSFNIDR